MTYATKTDEHITDWQTDSLFPGVEYAITNEADEPYPNVLWMRKNVNGTKYTGLMTFGDNTPSIITHVRLWALQVDAKKGFGANNGDLD